jgi:hypothetical protein
VVQQRVDHRPALLPRRTEDCDRAGRLCAHRFPISKFMA